MNSTPRIYKYCCEPCGIKTDNKKDYNRHLFTAKHKREIEGEPIETPIVPSVLIYTCLCNQNFNSRTTLWRHKKQCIHSPTPTNNISIVQDIIEYDAVVDENIVLHQDETNNDPQISESMMYKLFEIFFTKMTETITETMTKSNQELKQTITELANRPTTINNNTNNCTITTNVFLNVNCKDAMTLETYLNGIKVEPAHIWLMLKEGSCAGFCEILKSSMNQIKLTDRPIHCTDPKRNTHWIKHETGWEKELENKSMNRVCSRIKHRSGQTLMNIIDADPEYKIPNTDKNETMLKLMKAATGSGVSGGQYAIDATIIKYAEDNVIHLTKEKMTQAIQTTGP